MRRRFFNLAAGASAVLAVFVVGAWLSVPWLFGTQSYEYRIDLGPRIQFGPYGPAGPDGITFVIEANAVGQGSNWRALGFQFGHHPSPLRPLNYMTVPYWFLTLLTLILPAWWLAARLRRRRDLPEHPCPKCGYDLRGTLAAARTECPECGQAL